jgi:hypothetical protein
MLIIANRVDLDNSFPAEVSVICPFTRRVNGAPGNSLKMLFNIAKNSFLESKPN